jgi:hypothetical protein
MSISVDPHKLEKLERLSEALELLQNPEGYTKMIAEAKAVLRIHEEVSARYATVEAAERFLQESKKVLTTAKKEAAATMEALAAEKAAFEKAQKEKMVKLQEAVFAAQKRERELGEREARLSAAEKELAGQQEAFREQKDVQSKSVSETTAKLAAERAELDRRKAALTAALQ